APSRAVVEAALEGLAAVRHRGAMAADARTADGTGLLTTIPSAVYGEGVGVANLFTRPGAADPTGGVADALAAEGLEVVGWRTPPPDRGRSTRRPVTSTRPSERPTGPVGTWPAPARAPTWSRARSAPSPTRAWSPPTRWPASGSTWPTRPSRPTWASSTSASP